MESCLICKERHDNEYDFCDNCLENVLPNLDKPEPREKNKCGECGKKIVHPERIYVICLDCLIEEININNIDITNRIRLLEEKYINSKMRMDNLIKDFVGER